MDLSGLVWGEVGHSATC